MAVPSNALAAKPLIVITRPQAQAEPWAEALNAQGFETRLLNLLEIAALSGDQQTRAIQTIIMDFDLYQKAIFVSQNAVHTAMEWLDRYWPQLPVGIDYFAVGATSARSLAQYGVSVINLAQSELGSMTSESLLAAPELQSVAGEKIVIFRGLGGRGHLADTLRARGAKVDYCELYERRLPVNAPAELQALMANLQTQARATLVALHSGESLANFYQLLRSMPATLTWAQTNISLLVPSARVAAEAQALGFTQVLAAENATDGAMLKALLDVYH